MNLLSPLSPQASLTSRDMRVTTNACYIVRGTRMLQVVVLVVVVARVGWAEDAKNSIPSSVVLDVCVYIYIIH